MKTKQEIMAALNIWCESKNAPRLKTITSYINNQMADLGYRARIEGSSYSPDIRPSNYTYRTREGVDRYGNRLRVEHYQLITDWRRGIYKSFWGWREVIDHNSAETYRKNIDVISRLRDLILECPMVEEMKRAGRNVAPLVRTTAIDNEIEKREGFIKASGEAKCNS